MAEREVDQAQYSTDWIAGAWGDAANRRLLSGEALAPRPRVARAIELAAPQPGMKLLDIACGRGEVPAIVCQHGAYAVGLDYSEASIDFARKVRELHGRMGGGMLLARADACRLPFADGSFDRVTMLDIIEHLTPRQLEDALREVKRVLKDDGYVVIHTLPNRWVYDIAYPLAHRVLRRIPKDPRNPYEKKIHINEQDIVGLHRMLARLGYRHRLWLEQHMPAQARWSAGQDSFGDQRGAIYPMLAGVGGRVLEMLSHGPLKLLLCNDIYGLLWKSGAKPTAARRVPQGLTERLVCILAGGGEQA